MWYLIAFIVVIAVVAFFRSATGSSAAALYRRDPQAGLLHIARHWLEGQPKIDNSVLSQSWPTIEAVLRRPEVLDRYTHLVAERGTVTGNTLIQAFTQWFMAGELPEDMAREIEKCWKGRSPSSE